jgi:voltage-gated potassium channel
MNMLRVDGALEQFERRTAWPIMGVVVASLVLLLLPIFIALPTGFAAVFAILEWMLWLVFVAEYSFRWYLAMDRRSFVRHNLIDLAIVALPVVPALRALRLARLLRIGVVGARVVKQSDTIVKRSNVKYAVPIAALIILLATAMMWYVEHDNPAATIHSLPDSLWWALTTVTTVGYGDRYPVTAEGKIVALSLMVLGIAVFGLVTATLASLFVEHDAGQEVDTLKADITRLESKVDRLLDLVGASTESERQSDAVEPD